MRYAYKLLIAVFALAPSLAMATDFLLTMNSFGPVKIGMTADDAYKNLLPLAQVKEPEATWGCEYYEAMPGVFFMLDDKRIVRIEVHSKEAVTPSGIRVGDSMSKLKKTFGDRLDDQPHHYVGPEARTVKLFSNDRKIAMRFEVFEDQIREIYSGYEHSIHYVEGCY